MRRECTGLSALHTPAVVSGHALAGLIYREVSLVWTAHFRLEL